MKFKIISFLMLCLAGMVTSVTPHRFCYKDYPILDGLLCYKTCKAGYSHKGGGPVCWASCPHKTTDIGAVCVKHSYGRGAGRILSTCPGNDEKIGSLCYPKCKGGYYSVGTVCWAHCRSGYANDGALCRKNAHIYRRNNSGCPWYDKCGLCGGPWYNRCGRRRHCGAQCNSGYLNDGCTCRRNVHIYAKSSYGRGAGKPLGCRKGEKRNGALCYKPCKRGYSGAGPVCWAKCHGRTIDTGAQCQKKSYGRGFGKVVNCLKLPSKKDITNFTGLVDMFKKADGFKNLQSAACTKQYQEMVVWMSLVQTFNNCFAKAKWQTISISYSSGVAGGWEAAAEIGIAADTKTREVMCYYGGCDGAKFDASNGAEISIGWWRNLDDIPGRSKAYTAGVDAPFTERGITATFITNTYNEYIGTQLSFGIGIGLSLVDLSFSNCNTPQNQTIFIDI